MGKTGVVILNYITWQQTERCIKSLKETENADELQIYVVDNASPEKGELRRVCREAQVELIENPNNSGYAAGNNVGIVKALTDGCDYIVISNNDIEYRAGCRKYWPRREPCSAAIIRRKQATVISGERRQFCAM